MIALYDAAPQVTDPLAILLAAASGCLSFLLGLVVALVSARAKHVEEGLQAIRVDLQQLWIAKTKAEGDIGRAHTEIEALKQNTLTREIFETRQTAQDEKLDKLDHRVERVDRALAQRPTKSEIGMPSARLPREEPPSDPPVPPRPRLPSRPRFGGGE